jgi:hypothetical protein
VDEGEIGVSEPSDDARSDQLQHDIEDIRENIGGLVTELDHRRHDAFNVKRQIRRHGPWLALGGLALVGLIAGGTLLARRRARARRRLPVRAARVAQALVRLVKDPERQAPPPPSVGLKILAAAGTAAASVLAKRLATYLVERRPGESPGRS